MTTTRIVSLGCVPPDCIRARLVKAGALRRRPPTHPPTPPSTLLHVLVPDLCLVHRGGLHVPPHVSLCAWRGTCDGLNICHLMQTARLQSD